MLRYVLLIILVGASGLNAYKLKRPPNLVEEVNSDDYEYYDYNDSAVGKDAETNTSRPAIFQYWSNLLKRARFPNLNISNPFTKLFTPYVVKVDFPPGTDPNENPPSQQKPVLNKNKKKQDNFDAVDSYPETYEASEPLFYYDSLMQQYYEILPSQNRNEGFYATAFNEGDEMVINLGDVSSSQIRGNQQELHEENSELRSASNFKNLGRYNSLVYRKLNTKRANSVQSEKMNNRNSQLKSFKLPEIKLLAII